MNPELAKTIGYIIGYLMCGFLTHVFLLMMSTSYVREVERDGGSFFVTVFIWWFVAPLFFCEWLKDGIERRAYKRQQRNTARYWKKKEEEFRRSLRK